MGIPNKSHSSFDLGVVGEDLYPPNGKCWAKILRLRLRRADAEARNHIPLAMQVRLNEGID